MSALFSHQTPPQESPRRGTTVLRFTAPPPPPEPLTPSWALLADLFEEET